MPDEPEVEFAALDDDAPEDAVPPEAPPSPPDDEVPTEPEENDG